MITKEFLLDSEKKNINKSCPTEKEPLLSRAKMTKSRTFRGQTKPIVRKNHFLRTAMITKELESFS
jgi:hypothetical protein